MVAAICCTVLSRGAVTGRLLGGRTRDVGNEQCAFPRRASVGIALAQIIPDTVSPSR
jgi:hypothetical protein